MQSRAWSRWVVAAALLVLVSPVLAQEDSQKEKQAQARIADLLERSARLSEEGKPAEACAAAEQAVQVADEGLGPDALDTAACLSRLAVLLVQTGDLKRARSLLERGQAIYEKVLGPEHPRTAQVLDLLASVLDAAGDQKESRVLCERALSILEKLQGADHPLTLLARSQLGSVLQGMGDLAGARSQFERALATCEKVHGPEHSTTAMCLNNLASVLEAAGDRKGARPLLERAVAICEKGLGPEHPLTAQALANLSLLLMDLGEREAARPYAERAWKVNIGQLRTLLPAVSGAERCAMVQERTLQLHAYLSVFHADPSLTYEAVLAWKGAALRVDSTMLRLSADAPAEARAAARQLAETRRALATLVTSSTASAERQPAVEERGHALALEVGRLERELGERVPDLAARAFREVRTADVLAALPEDAALLDVVESQGFVHAWVLRKGREVAYACLGRAADLEPLCERFRTALEKDDEAHWTESGGALRSRLSGVLDAALEGTRTLYVSPDGALATVPLGLLPSCDGASEGKPEGKDFLLERCPVVQVTSGAAFVLSAPRQETGSGGGLLVLGGVDYDAAEGASGHGQKAERPWSPLAATLPEAKAVEERFRARFPEAPCRSLVGKAATEGAFGREAHAVRFVHAATHGYFDLEGLRAAFAPSSSRGFSGRISATLAFASEEAQPRARRRGWNPLLLSGLVLAGANAGDGGDGTDGWLSAEELQDLDLRGVELVVLSACETGRGDLAAGEGVLGLSRALTVAGAGGFVLSLWQVPDAETSDLMERFYDGLWKEGQRPESALRAAQIHLLEGDRAAGRFRPSTWGAWVLTR